MSFDYLNDLFGRFRKGRKTRYSDVETRARKALTDITSGAITYDEFYSEINEVIAEFLKLTESGFDSETPLWINSFAGYIFLRWSKWHELRKMHELQPEKFNTPELEANYRSIVDMNYDRWMLSKARYCIDNLQNG